MKSPISTQPTLNDPLSIANAYLYIGLAACYLAVSTPFFFTRFPNALLGWEHVAGCFVLLGILVHFTLKRQVNIVRNGLDWIAVPTMIAIVLTGGINGSGIYFVTPGIALIFFISRRQVSLLCMLLMGLAFCAALVLSLLGFMHLPYKTLGYVLFLFGYGLTVGLLYLYAKRKDMLDIEVYEKTQRLTQEIKKSKALAAELAEEKAGVELKVVQRTRQLSREQTRFLASINSLHLGYAMTDVQDNFIYINAAMHHILGLPDGKDFSERLRATLNHTADLDTLITRCRTTLRSVDIAEVLYGTKYLRLFLTPIVPSKQSQEAIGTVVLVEDITDAKVLARSRDEFFSIASHELRTPLAAIRGNASLLRQFSKKLDADSIMMVDDIHDASVRLIDIVNQFLDMSRLEQGKIQFQVTPVALPALVEQLIRDLSPIAADKHIHLVADVPADLPAVAADADRLRQSLINLVGNALKYTDHGSVVIRAQAVGRRVKIAIVDNGPGIPKANQSLLFKKFQQASDDILTRDTTRSTGLGLYITRLMAEGMSGKAYLDHTVVGKGSTFAIELPLAKPATKA